MTKGNINGWVHVDMKKKQQAKVYALQTYIARANKSVLEFFFNLWQACAWKFFDTYVCSEPCYRADSASPATEQTQY